MATDVTGAAVVGGPGSLARGFRLILRPGIRPFVLLPLLGNIVLYALAATLAFGGLDWALDRWLPEGWDWLRWLLVPVLALLLLLAAVFTFTLLANLLLAPFNGMLAARVEKLLRGRVRSPPQRGMLVEARRTVADELRRWGYVLLRLLGVFVLGFIPVVGVLAVPLGIALGAWFLAMEFAGNALGNWGYGFDAQRRLLRSHWPRFLGFGLATMGLALVPGLNLALVPAAVAGATALCLDLGFDEGADDADAA